jgi:filamentous hemagglutinin family protein
MNRTGRIFRSSFLYFVSFVVLSPSLLFALPEGGQVVSGQATIQNPNANSLVINQSTNQLITNWQQFNIGASQSVRFNQPSASSVALNRVTSGDPSSILGSLSANGQVFITNPSGILFGPGARVNVGGLVASTLNISDQDFLNGNYNFFQDPTRSLSSIINQGNIKAGYVGFLAPSVQNKGTIVASLGSVALASGTEATLDFTGDGLINFAITGAVDGVVTDSEGNVVEERVVNTGYIEADGGRVTLAAQDVGGIVRNVVNNSGKIRANTIEEKNGEIWLLGGDQGIVNVTGELVASGDDAGENGGTIHVLGDKVGLFETASLDVSGPADGGTVLVGGDFQGKGEVQNASQTYVSQGVTINASAVEEGNGGKVILWADQTTQFFGNIFAKGGSESGDGGFVEVSGKENLGFFGKVDNTALNGETGTLLLDPRILRIENTNGGIALSEVNSFTPDPDRNLPLPDEQIFPNETGLTVFNDGSDSSDEVIVSQQALEAIDGETNIILQADEQIIIGPLANNVLALQTELGHYILFVINDEIGDLVQEPNNDGDVFDTSETNLNLVKQFQNSIKFDRPEQDSIRTEGGNIVFSKDKIPCFSDCTDDFGNRQQTLVGFAGGNNFKPEGTIDSNDVANPTDDSSNRLGRLDTRGKDDPAVPGTPIVVTVEDTTRESKIEPIPGAEEEFVKDESIPDEVVRTGEAPVFVPNAGAGPDFVATGPATVTSTETVTVPSGGGTITVGGETFVIPPEGGPITVNGQTFNIPAEGGTFTVETTTTPGVETTAGVNQFPANVTEQGTFQQPATIQEPIIDEVQSTEVIQTSPIEGGNVFFLARNRNDQSQDAGGCNPNCPDPTQITNPTGDPFNRNPDFRDGGNTTIDRNGSRTTDGFDSEPFGSGVDSSRPGPTLISFSANSSSGGGSVGGGTGGGSDSGDSGSDSSSDQGSQQAVQGTRETDSSVAEGPQPVKEDPADLVVLFERVMEEFDDCPEGDDSCRSQ